VIHVLGIAGFVFLAVSYVLAFNAALNHLWAATEPVAKPDDEGIHVRSLYVEYMHDDITLKEFESELELAIRADEADLHRKHVELFELTTRERHCPRPEACVRAHPCRECGADKGVACQVEAYDPITDY
jgi:hypothetical protein